MAQLTKIGIKGQYFDISIREVISDVTYTIVYNPLTIKDIDLADEWVITTDLGTRKHKIAAIERDERRHTRRVFLQA